jgi:hypothetical protein
MPWCSDEATIKILADVGVVFLMFALGLDFSFKKLHAVGVPALVTAAFEIMVMTAVGYQFGGLLGWSGTERLFLGIMLSLTSSTIVIKSLRDAGELQGAARPPDFRGEYLRRHLRDLRDDSAAGLSRSRAICPPASWSCIWASSPFSLLPRWLWGCWWCRAWCATRRQLRQR